uniref:Glutamate--cysteine ligase n=1 Tax=Lotharella globosa TaxID=91324 RepID=A0A7S3YWG9_9EUKA
MGFLVKGKPLSWKESEGVREYVRKHGVEQFIHIWKKNKDREDLDFLWGDEVEGFLCQLTDKEGKKAIKLSLRGSEVLEKLKEAEKEETAKAEEKDGCGTCPPSVIFHPEYGCFMIETTPSAPYGGFVRDLRCVEANMRLRRAKVKEHLKAGEVYSTMTTYPLMGVDQFTLPPHQPNGPVAKSEYVPDELINPHPRFATLTANIRTRRGSKVDIRVPMFKDDYTLPADTEIHMDAMAFGMGCCCLQTTFLARNLEEARSLYDHLAVLGPIMLALTAATPLYRGRVADTDVRWSVISQSVDDRTPEERGAVPEAKAKALQKSRYDSISLFIADAANAYFKDKYNDLNVKYDKDAFERLRKEGLDEILAKHIAHLWIRDPLVIYKSRVELDDTKDVDHFENIQSTNWQSVRFKPPPNPDIGWRVEFRTMEV